MGSKSTNIVSTTNDESQIQALAAVRGDGNTTQILDGDAIKQAFTFGTANAANQSATIGEVLKTVDSLSTQFIGAAAENSNATIKALQNGMATATGSIHLDNSLKLVTQRAAINGLLLHKVEPGGGRDENPRYQSTKRWDSLAEGAGFQPVYQAPIG